MLWLGDHNFALVSGDQLVVRHVSFRQANAPLTTADRRVRDYPDNPMRFGRCARAMFHRSTNSRLAQIKNGPTLAEVGPLRIRLELIDAIVSVLPWIEYWQ